MGIPRVQNPAHSALQKPRESPTPPALNLAVAMAYRFRKFPLQVGMPWRVYVVTPVETGEAWLETPGLPGELGQH